MDEVLTVEEVANLLKIHRTTVYRMLKSGELPAFKIGSDWRFNRVHIEEWLKSRTQLLRSEPTAPGTKVRGSGSR
jgi:excisionase family DNA binding protein